MRAMWAESTVSWHALRPVRAAVVSVHRDNELIRDDSDRSVGGTLASHVVLIGPRLDVQGGVVFPGVSLGSVRRGAVFFFTN